MAEIQFKTLYDWWRDRMKEKKDRKEKGKKYLAGYLDFGILGKKEAFLFKNDRKEKDNQPAFRLVIKEGENWKEVGAFWVREIKPKEEEEVIDFV
jgi:uncharacterized protein (DUF736 family)